MKKLESIENMLTAQNLLQKEFLNLNEASQFLDLSTSYLYKLTSTNQIPFYSPLGKKLFFKRCELEQWITSGRRSTVAELEQRASDYISKKSWSHN